MKQLLRGGSQQEVPTFSPSAKMFYAKVVSELYSSLENYKIKKKKKFLNLPDTGVSTWAHNYATGAQDSPDHGVLKIIKLDFFFMLSNTN